MADNSMPPTTDKVLPAPWDKGKITKYPTGFGKGWRTFTLVWSQVVLVGIAIFFTARINDKLADSADPRGGADAIFAFLFVGGLYAMIGAILRLQAHGGFDDQADYWGKQFGLTAALVAFIGGAVQLPLWTQSMAILPILGVASAVVVFAAAILLVRKWTTPKVLQTSGTATGSVKRSRPDTHDTE